MLMPITRLSRPASIAAAALAACLVLSTQVAKAKEWPGILEAKDIAEEGFIYGLPIVMNYAVMYAYAVDRDSGQFKAPFNEIKNEARVFTYKDTAIVTPNSDTPYSFLWMDLRAEPMVLSVPEVEKSRYYAVQLEDGNTFNFGYIGSRATGNDAGDYMVVGPDWQGETPAGIKKVFRSSTQFAVAGYRTQLFGPDDIDNVKKVQAGYKAKPLSAYLGTPAPPPAPKIDFPKIDKDLVKSNFFEYLDFALQFAPPGADEKDIRAKLAKIGVGAGKSFDFHELAARSPAGDRPRHEGGATRRLTNTSLQEPRTSTAGRSARGSATAPSSTAIGCCAPPGPRAASTAMTPWKRPIPSPASTATARRSTAARPTTR